MMCINYGSCPSPTLPSAGQTRCAGRQIVYGDNRASFLYKYRIFLPSARQPNRVFCYFWTVNQLYSFVFFLQSNFYIATIVLQLICLWHCIAKQHQQKWLYIIIFLPLIGCVIYFFSEILTRRNIHQVTAGMGDFIQPAGSLKKLEQNLQFSDTFNNRVALGDAYLRAGQTAKAAELYESCLHGAFTENEYAIGQLILASYAEKRYDAIVELAPRIAKLPQFERSRARILYAMSLGYTGQPEQAEKEFQQMNGRFSNFEARYYFALFLQQQERYGEARSLLNRINEEVPQLGPGERRFNRQWIQLARDLTKTLPV